MEKSKKSVLFKKRYRVKKIILSSVIAIAMAVLYLIPVSAEDFYIEKNFNILQFANNDNTIVSFGYDDNSDKFLSSLGTTEDNYRVSDLPYREDANFYSNEIIFNGVVFTSLASDSYRLLYQIDLGFDFYFDTLDFEFYYITRYPFTLSGYYLSDSDLVSFDLSYSQVGIMNIDSLVSSGYVSSYFEEFLLSHRYYTSYNNTNSSMSTTYLSSMNFIVYKVSVSISDLNKTPISNLYFTSVYNGSQSNNNLIITPVDFNFITTQLQGYILESQDDIYSQQLALAQEQTQMLEEIIGDVPSDMQNDLDTDQAAQDEKLEELNEDLDTINEPTMPPEAELPTAPLDSEEAEEVYEDINTVFNLDGLNLFNILVPTGCVGFLIFTVMRRF